MVDSTLSLTARIAGSYFRGHSVRIDDVPELIAQIRSGLLQATGVQEPAVSIADSIRPAYLVCLEDGLKVRELKRHLRLSYGMTPDDYRKKWGLPPDYPMVAAVLSSFRSVTSSRWNRRRHSRRGLLN